MISHKPLRSVSHNFGHSFISLMNYINDDYLLGHLLRQSRKTKINKLTVDILNDKAEPKELLTNEIRTSLKHYCNWFPTLVSQSGSSMDRSEERRVGKECRSRSARCHQRRR